MSKVKSYLAIQENRRYKLQVVVIVSIKYNLLFDNNLDVNLKITFQIFIERLKSGKTSPSVLTHKYKNFQRTREDVL